ncbi:MAG: hypothetical protein GY765_13600 [bacterium]|nr:hypothetical protein [bacterium]
MNGYKIKMTARLLAPVFFLAIFLGGCDLRNEEPDSKPSESFDRVYDKKDDNTYTAVDIKQTADGGYIILGKMEGVPYLLKIKADGNVMWDTDPADYSQYRLPVKNLLVRDGEYYFFCNKMELEEGAGLRELVLLKVDPDGKPEEIDFLYDFLDVLYESVDLCEDEYDCDDVEDGDDLFDFCSGCEGYERTYDILDDAYALRPLHAVYTDNGNILLLLFSEKYDSIVFMEIDEDYEIASLQELIKYKCAYASPFLDKRPHFVGQVGNNPFYYFQTYAPLNYRDANQACFSIRSNVEARYPAISLFNEGDEPISNPFIAMDWDGNYSYKALIRENIVLFSASPYILDAGDVHPKPELMELEAVFIKTLSVKGEKTVFFLGSSKDNRIVLYAYDHNPAKGALAERFKGKLYFGHTHIFEAEALIETKDNGLIILGTTYVAGQLGRLCIFKLSEEELAGMQTSQ